MLSAREMNVLMPNWETARFLGLGYYDYYQIYAKKSSLLLIEVYECVGRVQLSATKNYDYLLNDVYDLTVRAQQANHLVTMYEVGEGPVYLALRAAQGLLMPSNYLDSELAGKENLEQVMYKIDTALVDLNAGSPFDLFYAGKL
jgi:hypothetical protein